MKPLAPFVYPDFTQESAQLAGAPAVAVVADTEKLSR